jgi:hypothetical protein
LVSKVTAPLVTKTVGVRYAKDNIRCNSIHPSTVDTPLVQVLFQDPKKKEERLGEVPLGRLATVGMGQQDFAVPLAGEAFEILEVADQHLFARQLFEQGRARRRHRDCDLGPQSGREPRERIEQVGLGGDRKAAPPDMEVRIEHCILQLTALTAIFVWHRAAGEFRQVRQQFIDGTKTGKVNIQGAWNLAKNTPNLT